MSWTSYIIPKTVLRLTSPYNRDIRVLEEKGRNKLLVNGSRQSGEYILELWQYACCTFGIIPSPDIRSILILGVAGGTVIHLLHALYPEATMTGVDIDPSMIDIGKRYFGLSKVNNLKLVESEAQKYVVAATRRKKQWDMIVVDVSIGAAIPAFVGEVKFLRALKRIMRRDGVVLINYLREREYKKLSDALGDKLAKTFKSVEDAEIYFNRFFAARNRNNCGKIASC